MNIAIAILAAGRGERMKSSLPKVLHPLAGQPMVSYVVATALKLNTTKVVLVVGHGEEEVRKAVGDQVIYAEQREPLGTGHALLQTRSLLEGKAPTILVLYGDTPLITTATIERLVLHHEKANTAVTMLSFCPEDPTGYGRVLRDADGQVRGLIEDAFAKGEERNIREVNSGLFCFRDDWLWTHLEQIQRNEKGEYYLTDLVGMALEEGEGVEALSISNPAEAMGVNNLVQLAQAETIMRHRINERWMLAGVTIVDPASTYIEAPVELGRDTVIYPNTFLQGRTVVGQDCTIGPNAILRHARVGDGCRIVASVVEEATVEDGSDVGPFSHLRPGGHLGPRVHVGNFVEIKKSYLDTGTKVGHFSYVGDATIGRDVNIGAGTVTCNYDGQAKHQTIIEDGVFIGSDTMLVAPVRVGAGAKIGAGSVVTRDIPPHSVAYGVPARVKKTQGEDETPSGK
ncbi:MAG: bifunctional UDP-N-acetylglucosamine diphosphorylase/glucosamine-1-phosphate N-acetyltransferase GlmU [Anaerolineae bacterium]